MITHEITQRIGYDLVDKMGYVYHGNYPVFFDTARTEMLRKIGISYLEVEEKGYILPVRKLETEYLVPAFYDDLITVKVCVKEKPSVRLQTHYETYNQNGMLLNRAFVELIFVQTKENRPCRIPQDIEEYFNPYFL